MHTDMFWLLALPLLFGIAAYNLCKGVVTGAIQYGQAFGRPLTINRATKPTSFRIAIAVHVLLMGLALADLVYLMSRG